MDETDQDRIKIDQIYNKGIDILDICQDHLLVCIL